MMQTPTTVEKIDEFRIANSEAWGKLTIEQMRSYNRLCERFGQPLNLWVDNFGALMCDFQKILIGIEIDGYSHS